MVDNCWRCAFCGFFGYAIAFDWRAQRYYPADRAAAPSHRIEGEPACHGCFEMWSAVFERDYFRKLHNEWESNRKRALKRFEDERRQD